MTSLNIAKRAITAATMRRLANSLRTPKRTTTEYALAEIAEALAVLLED